MLAVGSILFTQDANEVIIRPIMRMIEKIQRIAKNPIEAASKEDKEAWEKEKFEENQRSAKVTSKWNLKSLLCIEDKPSNEAA